MGVSTKHPGLNSQTGDEHCAEILRLKPVLAASMRIFHDMCCPLLLLLLTVAFTAAFATAADSSPSGECVLCRQCGVDVSDGVHLINQFSPLSLLRANQSLFGARDVQVQILENPLGVRFRIATFSKAFCAVGGHTWHNEHSWFPGYVWKHCLCPRCGHHLGWVFVPKSFDPEKLVYALSLDNVLSDHFSDSLMIVPKAFQS